MPRNISDEEYGFLQGKRQIADFVESIYNDPNLSREAKALIKKKYPQLQIPDYDIEERVERRLAEAEKQRTDQEAARAREADEAHWREQRGQIQKRYNFTDEAMTDLEKMMIDRNIGDYEVAASYKAQRDPKPSDATFDTFRWNHDKQPGFADIARDPEGWGRGEIMKALRADQERERGR